MGLTLVPIEIPAWVIWILTWLLWCSYVTIWALFRKEKLEAEDATN